MAAIIQVERDVNVRQADTPGAAGPYTPALLNNPAPRSPTTY